MVDDQKYTPALSELIPSVSLTSYLHDLYEFRNFVEKLGIPTDNTRIERYIAYLQGALGKEVIDESKVFKNSNNGPFHQPLDWLLYVLREIHELIWIMKGLNHPPNGLNEKLEKVVGGRDFAALDTDTLSRNTQFELRIASYFCQAGCEVDLSTLTDVIALTEKQAFYIECKRIGSQSQLSRRLSEAKKQLKRRMPIKVNGRNTMGCIAVDVTKVAFSHNGLTFATNNDHSRNIIQNKLIEITSSLDQLHLFNNCKNIFNYWFQVHIPTLILNPRTVATRFSSYQYVRKNLGRKMRRGAREFFSIFKSASQKGTYPASWY